MLEYSLYLVLRERPQAEVIGATMLEESPCLLHGLHMCLWYHG